MEPEPGPSARARRAAAAASFLLVPLLAAALVGCAAHVEAVKPQRADGQSWSAESRPTPDASAGAAADLRAWFDTLPDRRLRSLIQRAMAQNLDVAAARSRIASAHAQLELARSSLLPSLNLSGNAGRARIQRQNLAGRVFPAFQNDQFQTQVGASWELDLFGSVAASVEASKALLASAQASARATEIGIAAQVMQIDIDLRTLRHRRRLVKESVQSQQDTYRLTQSRGQAGLASQIDVDVAGNQTDQLDSSLALFDEQIERDTHALAVLLGQSPLDGDAAEDRDEPVDPLPPVPLVVPSEWLRLRPDIIAAEAQAQAAAAQLAVARASYFPNLMLTAGGGASAFQLEDLYSQPSLLWNVGLGASQALFSGGRLDANRKIAAAALEQQELAYRKTVLIAMQEVEDQLSQLRGERARELRLQGALRQAKASRDRAADLYKAGLADALSLLVAERTLLSAQDSLEQARENRLQSQVGLFKALGAGWNPPADADGSAPR